MSGPTDARADARLLALLEHAAGAHYRFVTPTSATVRRRLAQAPPAEPAARDVLGWGFDFAAEDMPPLHCLLKDAGVLEEADGRLRSRLRIASLDEELLLHAGGPGAAEDAVFLGPDSYRFARLIQSKVAFGAASAVLDIGTGAGVGALVAARLSPGARLTAIDINPKALTLARINLRHAGLEARLVLTNGLADVEDLFDLIVANPPYVAGRSGRIYKDGGDMHGARLSLDWTQQALERLAPGGRFVLYTGSPISMGGRDILGEHLKALARKAGCALDYEEIDPDIFGGELRRPEYRDVERIAAIGAVFTRPS
ncbi:methyltransferase [Caulobacter endophyticus]|uniref:Methyltransferase n=2 Tax=Caulobacter endophyticus TaxID=2172652 RepID=A0A2T9KCG3_9CAUL|nr:methyltransferase [Caulobacter endophyticus]